MPEKKRIADLLEKKKFILASSSPRRAEILTREKVRFEIKIPHNYKEENIFSDLKAQNSCPVTYVLELSKRKAESVAGEVGDGIILGADTIVVLDGEIFGKPKNKDEALLFLKKLSGRIYAKLEQL